MLMIEIPSRGRPDWLRQTLAQLHATFGNLALRMLVSKVVVVLSQRTDIDEFGAAMFGRFLVPVEAVVLPNPGASLPDKHRAALSRAEDADRVLILHDDLLFDGSLIENLDRVVRDDPTVGAAAGIYPLIFNNPRLTLSDGYRADPMFQGRLSAAVNYHQIARYPDVEQERVRYDIEHLFGPFEYRVEALKKAGGFPTGLSRTSHREETWVTNNILKAGYRLAVVKDAIAVHCMVPKGGAAEDRQTLMIADEQVFRAQHS